MSEQAKSDVRFREIQLTRGSFVALVDETDYELVSQYGWWAERRLRQVYARTKIAGKNVYMHRFILGTLAGLLTHHRNGDGLDNRRSNLCMVTPAQNARAQFFPHSNSGFKGVHLTVNGTWQAYISVNYTRIYLGTYATKDEAAKAYDKAAILHFGEFAVVNLPPE